MIVQIKKDHTNTLQRIIDRLVAEGAAHATLVITYPDGRQAVLRASQSNEVFPLLASGFQ